MEIKHEVNGKKGKFYLEIDGNVEAQMIYSYAGSDKIIFEHTEVSEKLKGQGFGHKLLAEAVAFLRTNNIKAIPLCPFVSAVFKKNRKDYEDIIA